MEEALALWRGQPYESLTDDADHTPVVARLEELRSSLQERRIEALLDLGATEQALADLEPVLARTPFREHLWHQRMVALARLGRTEEALATYAQVRTLLSDELGLDPGPELQQRHAQVLARDTALAPLRPGPDIPAVRPAAVELPQRRPRRHRCPAETPAVGFGLSGERAPRPAPRWAGSPRARTASCSPGRSAASPA